MSEYDELVTKLRDDNACLSVRTAHEAADAIEELSKPAWIPVTERLPEGETEVLITDGKHVNKAYFCEHDGRCSFTFIDSGRIPNGYDEGATHWMPLPTPPKEETE